MMHGMIFNRSFFSVCLLALPFVIGCGGGPKGKPVAPAKGVVKFKGAPVAGASVLFSPKEGQPAMATTDKDGNFTLSTGGRPGAEIGMFKVVVTKAAAGETKKEMKPEDMQKMASGGASFSGPGKSEFPAIYSNLATTPLEKEVTADATKNVFELNLTE